MEAPRTALVTGASSGIGAATAALLARSGFRVFGTSRRETATAAEPAGVTMLKLDVRDDLSVGDCIGKVLAEGGRIDLLVNNAGYALFGAAEESTIAQAQALFDTNLFGAMRMANAVLPTMRANHSGRIINVSSIAGFVPSPMMAIYAASKHALEGWSQSIDQEVRSFGIRVLLVEPSVVRTGIDAAMPAPDHPLTSYDGLRRRVADVFEKEAAKALDPAAVGAAILDAAQAKAPRLRNPVGSDAIFLARMHRFLPDRLFDRMLRRYFRIDSR